MLEEDGIEPVLEAEDSDSATPLEIPDINPVGTIED